MATRIKANQLEAMERDDFSRMPAQIYIKGFIRIYAEYLELDPVGMVETYLGAAAAPARPVIAPENTSRWLHKKNPPSPALAPPVDRFAPPEEAAGATPDAPAAPTPPAAPAPTALGRPTPAAAAAPLPPDAPPIRTIAAQARPRPAAAPKAGPEMPPIRPPMPVRPAVQPRPPAKVEPMPASGPMGLELASAPSPAAAAGAPATPLASVKPKAATPGSDLPLFQPQPAPPKRKESRPPPLAKGPLDWSLARAVAVRIGALALLVAAVLGIVKCSRSGRTAADAPPPMPEGIEPPVVEQPPAPFLDPAALRLERSPAP